MTKVASLVPRLSNVASACKHVTVLEDLLTITSALTEDELQDRAFFIADTEAIASLNTKTPFLWAVETACDDAGDIMSDAISRMQLQAGAMSYHDEESYRGYFKVPLDSLFDDFMPDMSDESFGMEQLLGRYEINFS